MTSLRVSELNDKTLTIPTRVIDLHIDGSGTESLVMGTENVTSLQIDKSVVALSPCLRLQELIWRNAPCTNDTLPFPLHTLMTLTMLFVLAPTVSDDCDFPQNLQKLVLCVISGSVRVDQLTNLVWRVPDVKNQTDSFDLALFTTLTILNTHDSLIATFPTNLKRCTMTLNNGFDFSEMTNLTKLEITLRLCPDVTLPTLLVELKTEGQMGESNIGDLALKSFESKGSGQWTREMLEGFPKTLRNVKIEGLDESLQSALPVSFPLLGMVDDDKDDDKEMTVRCMHPSDLSFCFAF